MSDNAEIRPWETLEEAEVADCRIFALVRAQRRHPDRHLAGAFYYLSTADWVNVVATTADRDIVLIRQYRHGSNEVTLEIPGGIIDPGETPLEAAARELTEETGYVARSFRIIGRVRSNPAIIDNWTWTVLATDAVATGLNGPDEHEDIAVELRPLESIDDLLRSGAITHALVVDAFMWYRLVSDVASEC